MTRSDAPDEESRVETDDFTRPYPKVWIADSDAATKEFNLEKSMEQMVEEWSDMEFTINPYGETGTYTLSSVDSIQVGFACDRLRFVVRKK